MFFFLYEFTNFCVVKNAAQSNFFLIILSFDFSTHLTQCHKIYFHTELHNFFWMRLCLNDRR